MMTNAVMQAMIAELGEKIFAIILNNNHKVFIGAKRDEDNTIRAADIEFKNVAGCDMFGIHHVDHTWGKANIPYTVWFVTSFVEGIYATDELTADLPDLNKIR